jgi:NTE family protein
MRQKRIAVACQGGGSQCAFVAGALKALFEQRFQHRYRIVGLSGTSGGALTAALAWVGLLKEAHGDRTPIADSIIACWKDLSAQTPQEIMLDRVGIHMIRLVERGLIPFIATSPAAPQSQLLSEATARAIARPEFTDLGALLVKHIDFAALPALVEADSPVLLVGAADVLEGNFKIFTSARNEIKLEALLASAAVPNLFPAVWVDGHAYWDGIFSSNPPVSSFIRKPLMGMHPIPDEIWIIQVNRVKSDVVPETPSDIFDRRNHLSGNLSLRHELEIIEMVNLLLQEGALTDRFRALYGIDAVEPIVVRFIRMSDALQRGLDYPSKLSRQPDHIDRLIADGESQAKIFLSHLGDGERPAEPVVQAAPFDLH